MQRFNVRSLYLLKYREYVGLMIGLNCFDICKVFRAKHLIHFRPNILYVMNCRINALGLHL